MSTNDRNKLSLALRKMWVTGATALYDAVNQGIEKIHFGRHEKRAILVITDGQDTSSVAENAFKSETGKRVSSGGLYAGVNVIGPPP